MQSTHLVGVAQHVLGGVRHVGAGGVHAFRNAHQRVLVRVHRVLFRHTGLLIQLPGVRVYKQERASQGALVLYHHRIMGPV